MPFWGQSEDPPTFMICGFKKEHMLSLVQEINEQIQQTLHEYCSYSRVPDKFNQLLNLLPDLRDMAQCGVDFLYLKHRQSHAPQDSFLKNLLEAAKSN